MAPIRHYGECGDRASSLYVTPAQAGVQFFNRRGREGSQSLTDGLPSNSKLHTSNRFQPHGNADSDPVIASATWQSPFMSFSQGLLVTVTD